MPVASGGIRERRREGAVCCHEIAKFVLGSRSSLLLIILDVSNAFGSPSHLATASRSFSHLSGPFKKSLFRRLKGAKLVVPCLDGVLVMALQKAAVTQGASIAEKVSMGPFHDALVPWGAESCQSDGADCLRVKCPINDVMVDLSFSSFVDDVSKLSAVRDNTVSSHVSCIHDTAQICPQHLEPIGFTTTTNKSKQVNTVMANGAGAIVITKFFYQRNNCDHNVRLAA